jgi:hypothetical protein
LAPVIRLLEADGHKFTRLNSGGKHLLTATVNQLHLDALPLFAQTVENLRDTGLTHDVAVALTEKCFAQTLRIYARNGRRVWDARESSPQPAKPPDISTGPGLLALEGALVRNWAKPVGQKTRAAASSAGSSHFERDE